MIEAFLWIVYGLICCVALILFRSKKKTHDSDKELEEEPVMVAEYNGLTDKEIDYKIACIKKEFEQSVKPCDFSDIFDRYEC